MRLLLESLFYAMVAYVSLGALFGLYFAVAGVGKVDPLAKSGTLGFRILILPAAVAFWPLLLIRLRRGGEPPLERNAHRALAGAAERR